MQGVGLGFHGIGVSITRLNQADSLFGFSSPTAKKLKLFEEFSEHGIFHGITACTYQQVIDIKNDSFTIGRE